METLINLNNLTQFKGSMDALVDEKVKDKYTKPSGGIPQTDLSTDVQTKLDRISSQPDWNETNPSSGAYIKNKPESLPASDVKAWAKADNKPTYTANEVGALPSTTVIPTVTDTYSAVSSNAMSGKAVANAISGKANTADLPTEYAPVNAQANVIESIKVNNVAQTVTSKAVNITVPTKASDIGALPDTTVIPTITDTYSSTSSNGMSGKAVASAVASAIEGVTQFDYKVVSSLPSTGIKGTIYLLSNTKGEQDIYDEYLWINNAWEKIGTTKVDLTNYYTKTETNGLLGDKVDKVNGKGLSTNDFTNTYKTAIDNLPTSYAPVNAQANVIETVKVNNTALTVTDKTVNITVPSAVTESTVSGWGFTKNTGTYSKPSGGIPKTDLSSAVQSSLDKADSAIQDISGKQDKLTVGTNISIVNNVISATDTTYELATATSNGLMPATLYYTVATNDDIDNIFK